MDNEKPNIVVRFAQRSELDRINELRSQVNDVHVSGRPDIFRPGFVEELQSHIFEVFDSSDRKVIAAFAGDVLCGFATIQYFTKPQSPYNLQRRIYQVEEFGVDEGHRRMGVARAMVSFMKKDAAENGFDRIELDMWEFNDGARAFYEAAGFVTYRRYMELNIQGYPTRATAEKLLQSGVRENPGNWGKHSVVVGKCAEAIARQCGLDADKAYSLGLMHDIGRRFGVSHFRHVTDGMDYMNRLGYPTAARICLTHSFSVQNIDTYIGDFDVTADEKQYAASELMKCDYDDYDRLIQLCDAMGMYSGAVPIEKRMNDVKERYGRYPDEKWQKNIELLNYFSKKCGASVETLTSGITAD